mgnify:FL=1
MNELWVGASFLFGISIGWAAGFIYGFNKGQEILSTVLTKMDAYTEGQIGELLLEMNRAEEEQQNHA